jgi:hypothetical protein
MVAKKPRSKKDITVSTEETQQSPSITMSIEEVEQSVPENNDSIDPLKKRGRKPKGGKLFTKIQDNSNVVNQTPNIILHLKCSIQDLNEHKKVINQIVTDPLSYNPIVPPNIMTYNMDSSVSFSEYIQNDALTLSEGNEQKIDNDREPNHKLAYTDFDKLKQIPQQFCCSCSSQFDVDKPEEDDPLINMKDINYKLKKLKISLYKNANPDKKSACFWCTYEYDNHPCYIPKYEMNGEMFGYGSFCRPECAVAYLMKESIDDSTKFERYHLLNQIYSKVYNFKKNIKPAPSPYFLLEKYYGNLSIQEYRKLLKTEHMLLIIDKPMTRILPELHEDNEDFIMNIYGGKASQTTNQSGVYKVKKQCDKQKGPSKSSIIKESFGFA